jgi:hypothetical protein
MSAEISVLPRPFINVGRAMYRIAKNWYNK